MKSEKGNFLRTAEEKKKENGKYLSQQLRISDVHCGSVSLGISNLWFMKPTAPMTYIRSTVSRINIQDLSKFKTLNDLNKYQPKSCALQK